MEMNGVKLDVIGSRGLNVDIGPYLPSGVTEIITGGARKLGRPVRVVELPRQE